ncbi:AAA family ATPase [Thioalkalivibrio sp. ALE28]|uniref:AAA family ATPase n=1 Tax=Thioalkalivibrio sp. ALE28 TaxID=1158179 RepID=UPI0009DA9DFD|nr:AAA family ATPase [Thioalkalivibrio sp. ALE28]
MRPLHSISAENFLSLNDVQVELRDLNVLVGPNAAGKTNLLKVIQFLGDTVRTDLLPAIESHGGFEALRFRGARSKSTSSSNRIKIGIKAQVTTYASANAPDEYGLTFWQRRVRSAKSGDEKQILARIENLQFKRTQGRGRRITVRGGKVTIDDGARTDSDQQELGLASRSSGLSTLRRLGRNAGAIQVDELAKLFETFRVFEVDGWAARRPSRETTTSRLESDGSNVAAFLSWLSVAHPETFGLLKDDLSTIVPGIIDLELHPIGGSQEGVEIRIVEESLTGTTPLGAASFGTVRAIAILAMLHDPNPPLLTCVEEIDHGLHPHALDRIVERMRDAKERTQLIVVTHSPALVNRLDPSELIVCERNHLGESVIPAIDPELVAEMSDSTELDLGELWFSGALGGVL